MRRLNLLTIGAVERTALVACALAVLWLGVAWALT
jgi:hypothetical protein